MDISHSYTFIDILHEGYILTTNYCIATYWQCALYHNKTLSVPAYGLDWRNGEGHDQMSNLLTTPANYCPWLKANYHTIISAPDTQLWNDYVREGLPSIHVNTGPAFTKILKPILCFKSKNYSQLLRLFLVLTKKTNLNLKI